MISSTWRPVQTRTGRTAIQIHFRAAVCGPCPVKAQCTHTDRRSLTVQPQAEQEALDEARRRQEREDFRARYAIRAGIEGTISQAVRRSGLRTVDLTRFDGHPNARG